MIDLRLCPYCGLVKRFNAHQRRCADCQSEYGRKRKEAIRDKTWKPRGERDSTPRAAVSPTARNLEWAAGFLEGEGCFHRVGGGSNVHGSAEVNADQVNPEPLLLLQEIFGGSFSYWPGNGKRTTGARYMWRVCGARARGVMMTLYPLMMSERRKEQIQNALQVAV